MEYVKNLAKGVLETAIITPVAVAGICTGIYIYNMVIEPKLEVALNK